MFRRTWAFSYPRQHPFCGRAYKTDGKYCISYAILVQRVNRTILAYAFSEPVWLCRVRDCVLPETDCVTIRFPGSHPDAESRYRTLMDYIENHHLTVVGFSHEITLIDNGLTQNSSKYVTCISIPIE